MYKPRALKKKGSTIALVMIALIMLLLVGVGLLSLGRNSRLLAVRNSSSIAARCAADAGLTKAFFEMKQKLKIKPWNDSTLPVETKVSLPNSDTLYSYKIVKDPEGDYVILSEGIVGDVFKHVKCELGIRGPFDVAIYGEEQIWLKSGTSITSYNMDPCDVLSIGTNSIEAGKVFARTDVLVDGDVFVGEGGDPNVVIDSRNEAVITGDCYAQEENYEPISVTVPKYLQELPSVGTISGGVLTGPTKCDAVLLGTKESLLINRPVILYCKGIMDLDVDSQVVVSDSDPNAFLVVYVGGDFTIKGGVQVNQLTKDPRKLKIYMLDTAQNIQFMTEADFYGAIYAPSANLQISNSVKIYGSVIVKDFNQNVAADFYYDGRLKKGSVHDEFVNFAVDRWSE
jgi:hypothetical protein